jgi:hypothetical protein
VTAGLAPTTTAELGQLDLFTGLVAAPSTAPTPPRHRTVRPGDTAVRLPRPQPARPAAVLVADLPRPEARCPQCAGVQEPVPPTRFWYACRSCFPATFGA